MSSNAPMPASSSAIPSKQVAITYAAFLACAGLVYFTIAQRDFSSIQTMAALSQCFAMVFLVMQALSSTDARGISVLSLALHSCAFACRLSSTTWLNGYLPVDPTGDWFYQAIDVMSLTLAMGLLLLLVVSTRPRGRFSKIHEALPAVPALGICFALGWLLHANMDRRPLYDALWMTGILLASLAPIPQYWALSAHTVPASQRDAVLPGHALVALCMSQLLSAIYMWHARKDMTCDEIFQGFNHASWTVLAAHLLPLVMICDFSKECVNDDWAE